MGFGVKNHVDLEDYWRDLRPPLFKVRVLYLRPPQNVLHLGSLRAQMKKFSRRATKGMRSSSQASLAAR